MLRSWTTALIELTSVQLFLFIVLSLFSTVGPVRRASTASPPENPVSHVIVVSVDGLMPAAYVSPDAYGLQVPIFREMVRNGAWSEGAKSVFPTVTYPAHTSIATGTTPLRHGIVTNLAFDPLGKNNRGWRWYAEDIRAPTLWDAARQAGLSTALIWWPVTVGARATALVPEIWRAGTEEDVKLLRALGTPGILEDVEKRFPGFHAGFTPPKVKDESLTDIAVHLIESLRPNLLMLHIAQVDSEQHAHGPLTGPALAAVENADRQVARLIAAAKSAGIWDSTALIVLSDHGFAPISWRVRPGVLLARSNLVKLGPHNRVTDRKAFVAAGGGYAYIYLKDPADAATGNALSDLLLPLAGQAGSGIRRVYTQEEIRNKGGDPSAYLALEGAEGFSIAGGYSGDYISPSIQLGSHGYDPDRRDMRAALLVYGPPIVPGKIEAAGLIDIAPTIAVWLGLRIDKAEGTALAVGLRSASRIR